MVFGVFLLQKICLWCKFGANLFAYNIYNIRGVQGDFSLYAFSFM